MSELVLFTKPFSGGEFFDNILKKQFAKATEAKTYLRVPYDHWSIFKKNIHPIDKIVLEFGVDLDKTPVFVRILNGKDLLKRYWNNDGSLGQFLYDKFFPKEDFSLINDTRFTVKSDTDTCTVKSNYDSLVYSNDTLDSSAMKSNAIPAYGYGYADLSGSTDTYGIQNRVSELEKDVSRLKDATMKKTTDCGENKKGKEDKMTGLNFDFGPCTGDNIRMSMYGLAVKNAAGTWVSYNKDSRQIIDVDILNFDGSRFMFKMPAAIKDIKVGDIVVHNRVPMFITEIDDCGKLFAVDVRAGEEKCIIPTRNMFGFDFVTKIVSLFDMIGSAPSPDQPFGNMLPLLLAGSENGDGIDPMTMLLLTQGGNGIDTSNPLLLYALLKDREDTDSLLPLLLLGGNK